jgi:hypothetical protein
MEFTAAGSGLITFSHGWHNEVEGDSLSPHRWSIDPDTAIKIPKLNVSPLLQSNLSVEIDAIPYLPAVGPGFQDVIIFLDGALAAALRLYNGEIKTFRGHYSNPINNNPFSEIRMFLPHSAKPSMIGDGPDERSLGIGIKRLKLEFN